MSNLHRPQDCTVAPRRFAAYIRVSTRDQAEEGFSLEAQRDRLAAHVEREGGKLVAVYSDAGITGRADDRPELQRALADAEAGKFDALAVIKLDRFGRSNRALHENFERLARADVEFTSLFEAIDTTTAVGRFMRGIFASLAEFESDVIGTRVAAVTARRARAGKHNGGPRPYGFAYADDGGGLVPVVDEAAIVRRCFAEFAGGKSQARIARDLNAEGIRSAQGGDWHPGVVSNMLGREIYIGCVTLKGETFPGQHDAIIDADLWERVQTLRAASRKSPGGGRGRPTAGSHLFVRGALRCGECGEAIIPITKPNRSGSHYEAYDCYGRQRKKNGCTLGPIPRALIDTAVCDYFMEVGLDVEATREQLAAHQDRALAETAALLDRAERDAHTADERLARVRRHYQDG